MSAGTYTLHTKDNAGCSRDSIIVLSEPLAISFSNFSITPINCFGSSSGAITTSALGGVAPYQYQINLGGYSSNNIFSNVAPGNHTVSIHDANGCLKDTSIFINQPLPILFSAMNIVPPGCLGASTGLISFTGTGALHLTRMQWMQELIQAMDPLVIYQLESTPCISKIIMVALKIPF